MVGKPVGIASGGQGATVARVPEKLPVRRPRVVSGGGEVSITEAGYTQGGSLIVMYGGEDYHFMKNGILHWQDNTIANYKYYIANRGKFVNPKGNLASFGDVFKSQRQVYADIGTVALMDIATVLTRGQFDSNNVVDYHINVVWRSPYATLLPSYVAPKSNNPFPKDLPKLDWNGNPLPIWVP